MLNADASTIAFTSILHSYVPVFFTLNKVRLSEVTLTYLLFSQDPQDEKKRGEKVFLSRESSVDKQRDMTISGK